MNTPQSMQTAYLYIGQMADTLWSDVNIKESAFHYGPRTLVKIHRLESKALVTIVAHWSKN